MFNTLCLRITAPLRKLWHLLPGSFTTLGLCFSIVLIGYLLPPSGTALTILGLMGFIFLLPQPLTLAGVTFDINTLLVSSTTILVGTENLNLLTPQSLLSLFHKSVRINLKKHYLLGMPSNLMAYGNSQFS